ncbi:MAG: class I SAM-dependent methyltransferase [Bacteroidota bacterium]
MPEDYIHGYSQAEQDRLLTQGRTLAPFHHRKIDLAGRRRVLEIGCGVGSQLHLLREKYPEAHLTGVDIAPENIARASQFLKADIATGQIDLHTADAAALPFPENAFDAIVIVFVLEHIPDPLPVIREAHRVLAPGGVIYCTEVVNSQVYIHPPAPIFPPYWDEFNRLQQEYGCDTDIGMRLGTLFYKAGFRDLDLYDASVYMDARNRDIDFRHRLTENWIGVFMSAAETLIERGRVSESVRESIPAIFWDRFENMDAVVSYGCRQIRGVK